MNQLLNSNSEKEAHTTRVFLTKFWVIFLKALLFLCLVPFIILSFFNHPYYDDFGNAASTIKYGAWGVQKFLYNGWTGRYFSTVLLTLANPVSYGWIDGLRLTPLLFILLILVIIHQLTLLLLKGTREREFSFWLATVFLLVYFYAMPQVYQGFFWYTGAAVYQVGNGLVVGASVACYKALAVENTKSSRRWWSVVAGLAAGAATATNEVALIQMLGFIGICFLISISRSGMRSGVAWKFWLLLGVATSIAALFAVTSPGNFARLATQSDPHAKSLLYAIPRTIFSGLELVSRPQVWTSLLLLFMGWLPFSVKIAMTGRLSFLRLHPAVGLAGLFLLTCCCYFPFWWIWAAYTPIRTENAIVFYLLAGWLLYIQSVVVWLVHNGMAVPRVPTWISTYVVPLFGIMVLVRGAGTPAWLELSTNASVYNAHLNRREDKVLQQKRSGIDVIRLEPLLLKKSYGILSEGRGLGADASEEPNKYMARYFNVVSIQTNGDDGIIPPKGK